MIFNLFNVCTFLFREVVLFFPPLLKTYCKNACVIFTQEKKPPVVVIIIKNFWVENILLRKTQKSHLLVRFLRCCGNRHLWHEMSPPPKKNDLQLYKVKLLLQPLGHFQIIKSSLKGHKIKLLSWILINFKIIFTYKVLALFVKRKVL